MLEAVKKLFCDLEYFAGSAAKIDVSKYKDIIRHSSAYISEEGAYSCAIPKQYCASPEDAILILFLYCMYDTEEWFGHKELEEQTLPVDVWKGYLKDLWIPEYFSCQDASQIQYKQVDTITGYPLKDTILDRAIPSPPLIIIRYGDVESSYFFDHLVETKDEYSIFQSWITA